MNQSTPTAFASIWRDRRGIASLVTAATTVLLLGFGGLAIDVGNAIAVQRSLQSSSDAAALAGAQQINLATAATDPITWATKYSAVAGNLNASSGTTVTMASGYPKLKCLSTTGVACGGIAAANAVVVKQQATVPTMFARVLGIQSLQVSATSTAGASGGLAKPLNVMIVLDTTASMNTTDSTCSIKNATKIQCALAGVRTVLTTLSPSADKIGLMAFPGLSNATQAQYDYSCTGKTTPQTVAYNKSPVYQVVPLGSDYRSSNAATTLNASSDLVLASAGAGSSCTSPGIQAIGGYGTYYAAAITAAQTSLVANGNATTQNVIIFLSDGDANASASNMTSGTATNQCHEAIAAAQAAATAGTWVYSIAYGSSTSATGSCASDTPHISACATMQSIASDAAKFYSDAVGVIGGCSSGAQSISELVAAFQSIAYTLLSPRLLPDNTT